MESISKLFKSNIRQYGMIIALVLIMVLFQILTDGILLKPLNITNLILQNSYILVLAIGMLLVIITGHIDLSVRIGGCICRRDFSHTNRKSPHSLSDSNCIITRIRGTCWSLARLLGRLCTNSFVYRYIGGDATVSRLDDGRAERSVNSAFPEGISTDQLRVYS